MRKSRTFLDRYSLEFFFISFMRPLMKYANVIWDNQKQNLINTLREYSIRCSKNNNWRTRLTSHDSLYEETKWGKIER